MSTHPYTWVVDRTGLNTIHLAGCAHIPLNREVGPLDATTIEAAMIEIAVDNIDGFDPDTDDAGDWVAVSPCVRGATP